MLQSTIKHLAIDNTISTDDNLFQTINRIKCEIGDISGIHTLEQAILYAAQISAVYVGEALLKQMLSCCLTCTSLSLKNCLTLCRINVNQDLYSAANPNWLRMKPTVMTIHMAYRCTVKRYGTLLYRYGGDLVHALSFSLSQVRNGKPHRCHVDGNNDSNFCSI